MKIAYFLGTLKKEDGVARVLLALTNEAKKRGMESVIITGYAEDESISPVPVIQIPSLIFPLYKEYRIPLPGMRGFEKVLDEFKPDILHVHSPDTIAWAALKYAKKNKLPIIATYHTNFCHYLSYYHLSSLQSLVWDALKRLYKKMDLVTSPSVNVSQELIDLGIKNVCTIPWGVDSLIFNSSFYSLLWRNKILKNENKNIILYVGRLTWEKDFKTFIDTYKLLMSNRTDFVVVIAGDGPIRKELESFMPDAIFLGHIEGEELSKAYASSDVLLFPSSTETFGNVIVEAMSSGLVSIVADKGGSKSLIKDNENGFVVEPKNSKEFYKKISLLLDDKNLLERMRKSNLNMVKDYTWSKVFDDICQRYEEFTK